MSDDDKFYRLMEQYFKTHAESSANAILHAEKLDRVADGLEKLNDNLNNGIMGRVHKRIDTLSASQVVNSILLVGLIAQLCYILFNRLPFIAKAIAEFKTVIGG